MHTLFVNLSHKTLAETPLHVFIDASLRNHIYFELSEAFADDATFKKVAGKVNALCALGVNVAIDDFGNGHDGFKRLYALDQVDAIKIDGELLNSAYMRPRAAASLKANVRHWNRTGVLTIAECIETSALMDFAMETEFALVQGYYVDDLLR